MSQERMLGGFPQGQAATLPILKKLGDESNPDQTTAPAGALGSQVWDMTQ